MTSASFNNNARLPYYAGYGGYTSIEYVVDNYVYLAVAKSSVGDASLTCPYTLDVQYTRKSNCGIPWLIS